MKHVYITTAIPYVNGEPHAGHALEFIQADAFARYWRGRLGHTHVHLQTGSDENSLKNVQAAEKAGEDVATFVERHAAKFQELIPLMNLSFDDFIRTREERHIKGAQKLWSACKPEDIYKKPYKGLYCVGCEIFYTEAECPDGICPIHKTELEMIEEENYFFRLSAYQERLEELIEKDELKIMPKERKNEVLSFIRQGLQDFSISRSQERAKHWGIPVPGDEAQVMYVWFDALSNYINAIGYADDAPEFERFWGEGARKTHIIGKDITRFHAIYWPAMLLSAGILLPTEIYVHGFFTVEGEKMSKSLGNVTHPRELVDRYGNDALRYFMLREIPYNADGDLSKARLDERHSELANRLGNLVGRVAAMANSYFEGKLDRVEMKWHDREEKLDTAMNELRFKAYIDEVFEVVDHANEIIDHEEPFKLVKVDPDRAKKILSELAEMIRFCGRRLAPIIPEASAEILRRYNDDIIQKGDPLFPRLED